jgi:branched-chain amino acid transport system ATP-binding protein
MTEILKVNQITKHFGELTAIKDLSFEVEEQEIFGIAGPNGAGKTTLFNVITGFYRSSGDIIFDGRSIRGLRPHQICRRGICRTFQIPQLFLTLPVVQNVKVGAHFGIRTHQDERERIREAIGLVGLQGKEDVIAANLNLYDKKLTMIAAAVATKPKLLLLDEPVGGLSPTESRQFITLIQQINQELGLTIVVIEHLMKVLTEISQRLMILHNGEKICIGPPQGVTKDKRVIEIYLGG